MYLTYTWIKEGPSSPFYAILALFFYYSHTQTYLVYNFNLILVHAPVESPVTQTLFSTWRVIHRFGWTSVFVIEIWNRSSKDTWFKKYSESKEKYSAVLKLVKIAKNYSNLFKDRPLLNNKNGPERYDREWKCRWNIFTHKISRWTL